MSYGIRTKAFASEADVSVGTSDTVIVALTPAGLFSSLVADVSSDSGSAASLDSFKVQRRDHAGGEWYDYITTWASPYPLGLSFVSATPVTLAANATVHLHMDIGTAYGIRFVATVAADTADITIVGAEGCATLPSTAYEVSVTEAVPVEKVPVRLTPVAISAPGTPVTLATGGTFFRVAVIQAGRATAANTGLVSIGGNTAYTSNRQTELAPGETMILPPGGPVPGTKYDLNDWYVDGVTAADGVRIEYIPV